MRTCAADPLLLLLVWCSSWNSFIRFTSSLDFSPIWNGQQHLVGDCCEMIGLAWFTGLLWHPDLSPPYLTAAYFAALSHWIQALESQDHHLCKNFSLKHPKNLCLADLLQLESGWALFTLMLSFKIFALNHTFWGSICGAYCAPTFHCY